jgi:hypothetical protein
MGDHGACIGKKINIYAGFYFENLKKRGRLESVKKIMYYNML